MHKANYWIRKQLITEVIELRNQEKTWTFGKTEIYKYLGILEADTIKQAETKEKKRIPQENEKTTRNQTLSQ